MSLKATIEADIKKAMLSRNADDLRALRALKSMILLGETEKGAKGELTPDQEAKVLTKAHKQRKESADIFAQQGRKDLEEKELQEIEVIEPEIIKPEPRVGIEVDEDGDGIMDGIDFDGDGVIDVYFAHRNCEHVWGDSDNDGELECLKCGKLKEDDND